MYVHFHVCAIDGVFEVVVSFYWTSKYRPFATESLRLPTGFQAVPAEVSNGSFATNCHFSKILAALGFERFTGQLGNTLGQQENPVSRHDRGGFYGLAF